ncbi:copper amine oxidase N-terminal domain-containing protein [Bacteroides sp.]|uniref:copper amine oxidase N-terminal domain-containing protein n=1 Tax=Bacteroides sp. TaxID=29523 RepID=UPI0026025A04|nr:copper amine oxidase N-terminal domain-containing protein [Bacteroides sp.]MDD3041038.1 copper amine oxidase N-terminal domain-containing protein [Bacteroides sp.]
MKYHRLKDMLLGAVLASLIVGAAPTAFAKVSKMNIPVSFNNIKVIIDGKELKTDKEPFTYEGTTYLPVRAVAEAVGKNVSWDSTTQTVTLGDAAETSSSNTQTSTADSVLYNSNGIKITYKNVTDGLFGKDINLLIENTSNKDYTIQARNFSVNGYMVDPIFSCEVSAGKKANDEITITDSYLKENSIVDINEFELEFCIFETDSWSNSFDSNKISYKVK